MDPINALSLAVHLSRSRAGGRAQGPRLPASHRSRGRDRTRGGTRPIGGRHPRRSRAQEPRPDRRGGTDSRPAPRRLSLPHHMVRRRRTAASDGRDRPRPRSRLAGHHRPFGPPHDRPWPRRATAGPAAGRRRGAQRRVGALPTPHRDGGRHTRGRIARSVGRAVGPARRRGRLGALEVANASARIHPKSSWTWRSNGGRRSPSTPMRTPPGSSNGRPTAPTRRRGVGSRSRTSSTPGRPTTCWPGPSRTRWPGPSRTRSSEPTPTRPDAAAGRLARPAMAPIGSRPMSKRTRKRRAKARRSKANHGRKPNAGRNS